MTCDRDCPACRGRGTVEREGVERRGGEIVRRLQYTAPCPRGQARALFVVGGDGGPGLVRP